MWWWGEDFRRYYLGNFHVVPGPVEEGGTALRPFYLGNVLVVPGPVEEGVEGAGEGEHREQCGVQVAGVLSKHT